MSTLNPGTYTVTLIVTTISGCVDTVRKSQLHLRGAKPNVLFSYNITNGCAPSFNSPTCLPVTIAVNGCSVTVPGPTTSALCTYTASGVFSVTLKCWSRAAVQKRPVGQHHFRHLHARAPQCQSARRLSATFRQLQCPVSGQRAELLLVVRRRYDFHTTESNTQLHHLRFIRCHAGRSRLARMLRHPAPPGIHPNDEPGRQLRTTAYHRRMRAAHHPVHRRNSRSERLGLGFR